MKNWMNSKILQIAASVKPENIENRVDGLNKLFGTQPYDYWTNVDGKELICLNGEVRNDIVLRAINYPFDNATVELYAVNQVPNGWTMRLNKQGEKFNRFAHFSVNGAEEAAAAKADGWVGTVEGKEDWGGYINLDHPDFPWYYLEMYYIPGCDTWMASPIPETRTVADYLDDLTIREIGIAVENLEKTVDVFCRLYGREKQKIEECIEENTEYQGEKATAIRRRFVKFPFENLVLEFYEPAENAGIYEAWMKENGEGISHFTFAVKNLQASVEKATAKGLQILQKGTNCYKDYACLKHPECPLLYIRLTEE